MNQLHSAMKVTMLVGLAFVAGCAAMHQQQIANMKANGDPRAPCYEACEASDLTCMRACDEKHPLAGTALQGVASGHGATSGSSAEASATDEEIQQAATLLVAAAVRDEQAKKNAGATSSSSASESDTSVAPRTRPSTHSAVTITETKKPAPASDMDCGPCSAPRKCHVFLKGSKQCAPGGLCYTVDRTRAECR